MVKGPKEEKRGTGKKDKKTTENEDTYSSQGRSNQETGENVGERNDRERNHYSVDKVNEIYEGHVTVQGLRKDL